MGKRVGIYLRVSTLEQKTDIQKSDLLKYCERRGWNIVDLYEEKVSGVSTKKRPEFNRILRDAKQRKLDIVLVWKMDRFARSLRDLVNSLQELTDFGVDFVSLKDHLDFSTSQGRLMVHLLGAFAQFEADLIRSRVMAGLENARRKGKRLGKPPTLDHELIRDLRKKGLSLSQIAKKVGATKSGVSKSLRKQGL